MLFNSLSFAIFLPIVFGIYWLLPHKYRWISLLISSYYFYMSWNIKYVSLILFTTIVSYVTAIMVERTDNKKRKKTYLVTALIACLGVLFAFKYLNFFANSAVAMMNMFALDLHPITIKLLLPVGISFYTFQTLSYVIDVYRGEVKAEYHFGKYATFIAFFPQLVAGPIERTRNLLPQINQEHHFSYEKATYGLKLMVWGFFKKIVIADTLAKYVDTVYDDVINYHGFALVLATLFFAIQIYCDFSGYSDIAIGTAKLLDIDLMTNFKSPYFSSSIKEFWGRWHISLSTWFRDYIYIPMGGNRVSKIRHSFNLIFTFLVSGLWHGASWTFVLWGTIHGAAQVLENLIIQKKKETNKGIKWMIKVLFVFIFCSFAWIFFRAQSLNEAGYVVMHLFKGIMQPALYIKEGIASVGLGTGAILKCGLVIFILGIFDYFSLKADVIEWIGKQKGIVRYGFYFGILTLVIFLRSVGESVFVYFQF